MADWIDFEAEVVEWRGPPPFLFARIPEVHVGEIRYAALSASYGWGVVPVVARVGACEFATTLFPRDGTYLLPVKLAVRKAEAIARGDRIAVVMRVGRARAGCA
jgi:hypothetical protein